MRRRLRPIASLAACVALVVSGFPAALPAAAAPLSGLSGTVTEAGHTITWSMSGVYELPASLAAERRTYVGYTYLGQSVAVTGSMAFAGKGVPRNVVLHAVLTGGGAYGWSWTPAPSESRFSNPSPRPSGPVTQPFSLRIDVPATTNATSAPNAAIGFISVGFHTQDCDVTLMGCVGPADAQAQIIVYRTPPASAPATGPSVALPAFTRIITAGDQRKQFPATTPLPVRIPFTVRNKAGKAKYTAQLFSDGNVVQTQRSPGLVQPGKFAFRIAKQPAGAGPYFLCVYAEDAKGNRGEGKQCIWLSIAVPVSRWSNGCGSDGVAEGWIGQAALWVQNYMGNDRAYGVEKTRVQVKPACDIHDAAYAGVTIFDGMSRKYIDFRTWSRLRIDEKFAADIQRQCRLWLNLPDEQKWLPTCLAGIRLADVSAWLVAHAKPDIGVAYQELKDELGAMTYFDLVRSQGGVGYDADLVTPGTQPGRLSAPTNPAGGERDPA